MAASCWSAIWSKVSRSKPRGAYQSVFTTHRVKAASQCAATANRSVRWPTRALLFRDSNLFIRRTLCEYRRPRSVRRRRCLRDRLCSRLLQMGESNVPEEFANALYFFVIKRDRKSPTANFPGLELADMDAAWEEATKTAGEMIRDLDGSFNRAASCRLKYGMRPASCCGRSHWSQRLMSRAGLIARSAHPNAISGVEPPPPAPIGPNNRS